MSRRIVHVDGIGTGPRGRSFLYAFACAYEDLAKLGMSGDPMARLQAFSRRYYEFFDLEQGWLVEAETVKQARAWETHWKRVLQEHLAPAPLLVPVGAAGQTEWFRGALPRLREARQALATAGFAVHWPLSTWVREQVRPWRDELDGLEREVVMQWGGIEDWPPAARMPPLAALRDALDACVALSLPFDAWVSPALAAWFERNRLTAARWPA